jgi:hypothetical protein
VSLRRRLPRNTSQKLEGNSKDPDVRILISEAKETAAGKIFKKIPEDIFLLIFTFLSFDDALQHRAVNKYMKQIIDAMYFPNPMFGEGVNSSFNSVRGITIPDFFLMLSDSQKVLLELSNNLKRYENARSYQLFPFCCCIVSDAINPNLIENIKSVNFEQSNSLARNFDSLERTLARDTTNVRECHTSDGCCSAKTVFSIASGCASGGFWNLSRPKAQNEANYFAARGKYYDCSTEVNAEVRRQYPIPEGQSGYPGLMYDRVVKFAGDALLKACGESPVPTFYTENTLTIGLTVCCSFWCGSLAVQRIAKQRALHFKSKAKGQVALARGKSFGLQKLYSSRHFFGKNSLQRSSSTNVSERNKISLPPEMKMT